MRDQPHSAIPALLLLLTLFLTACAGVPFDYPKSASTAAEPDSASPLGKLARQWQQENDDYSGFFGLPGGPEALGVRLRMMELATTSIDAQYFIIKRDRAGSLFAGQLLSAADRGVRVRLLIDDIFSPGLDAHLAVLSSHPNIQVRLFNPLSRNSPKYWNFLADFSRANRRMHNKSFTVDNSLTIVGGRNIAEEYFELDQDVIFDDYEVLALGPVVTEVSAGFDLFWNSELAVPVEAFGISVDAAGLNDWRAHIRTEQEQGGEGIYAQAINSQVLLDIREGRTEPLVARAELVTDTPEKLLVSTQDTEAATLAREMAARLGDARSEIIIITPYFIPGKNGIAILRELEQRGVRVVIVTNSLASTNHVPVHSAYAGYRADVLRTGAELFELRAIHAGGETEWGHSPDMVTLHSKVVAIDRGTIFVGSLNFDPRSIRINSEMGLFIDSAQAGAEFAEMVMDTLPDVSYRLELDKEGRIQWIYAGEAVQTSEPGAGWGRRFIAGFYSLLPLESQL